MLVGPAVGGPASWQPPSRGRAAIARAAALRLPTANRGSQGGIAGPDGPADRGRRKRNNGRTRDCGREARGPAPGGGCSDGTQRCDRWHSLPRGLPPLIRRGERGQAADPHAPSVLAGQSIGRRACSLPPVGRAARAIRPGSARCSGFRAAAAAHRFTPWPVAGDRADRCIQSGWPAMAGRAPQAQPAQGPEPLPALPRQGSPGPPRSQRGKASRWRWSDQAGAAWPGRAGRPGCRRG